MKPGETKVFSCDSCLVEFSLTYEPKCEGSKVKPRGIKDAPAPQCPFCSADALTSDED